MTNDRKSNRNVLNSLLCIIIVCPTFTVHAQQSIKGYIKEDQTYLDGAYRVQQGEEIECQVKNSTCCFEIEEGTICIPRSNISSSPIDKLDYYLSDITFSDANDLKNDACASGKPIKIRSDSFIWSYGFKVNGANESNEPMMVELAISIESNGMQLANLNIVKRWTGVPDGKCKSLNVTKKDIDKFLNEYHKLRNFLSIEHDLNLDATVSIKLFSSRVEKSYENNKFEFDVMLPADNSAVWPPRSF